MCENIKQAAHTFLTIQTDLSDKVAHKKPMNFHKYILSLTNCTNIMSLKQRRHLLR